MYTRELGFMIVAVILFSFTAFSQTLQVFTNARGGSSESLSKYENGTISLFTSLPANYIALEDQIHHNHSYSQIAVILQSKGFLGAGTDAFIDKKLVVYSRKAEKIGEFANCQRLAWAPSGDELVYIAGRDHEGFGFRSDSIYIIGIPGFTVKVAMKIPKEITPIDISWAAHNSSIYIQGLGKGRPVWVLNRATRTLERTTFRGIHFSPSGKFYFYPGYEGESTRIYQALDNKIVSPPRFIPRKFFFAEWLPGDELLAGDFLGEKRVVEVPSMAEIMTITGKVIDVIEATKTIIVNDGRLGSSPSLRTYELK
jgi:hypothetical protein